MLRDVDIFFLNFHTCTQHNLSVVKFFVIKRGAMRARWLFYLCHYVIFFCVCLDHLGFILSKSVLYFFTTQARDWLGRTSPSWPILCRVGRKKLSGGVLAWLSVCSPRCRLAYRPADATATHCLASLKSRLVLSFWYRLIRTKGR